MHFRYQEDNPPETLISKTNSVLFSVTLDLFLIFEIKSLTSVDTVSFVTIMIFFESWESRQSASELE